MSRYIDADALKKALCKVCGMRHYCNGHVGFGTYKPEILSGYIRNYFIKPKGAHDNGPE